VAQQNGHPPTPNGADHRHPLRYESPIGPDEVYDQEADEAAYNEAMYNGYDETPTPEDGDQPTPTNNKEHVA
jgi:hypothetical protein